MNNGVPKSGSIVSRRSALSWTLLLILPNLAFFAWLFRAANPRTVVAALYASDDGALLVYRLPIAFLLLAAACAFFRAKRPEAFDRAVKFLVTPRGSALLLGAAAIVTTCFLGFTFLSNLLRAAWGVSILFCAAGIGLRLLESKVIGLAAKSFESPLERLTLGTALGLGALGLAVFAAGSFGLLNPWLWRAVILGSSAINFRKMQTLLAEFFSPLKGA